MKILSYGAGVQSTALVLMSCENAKSKGALPYPLVPIYDAVIYCDLWLWFGIEELHRCHENPHQLFTNHFPLVDMGMDRTASYAYILEHWGLKTKASACAFCPFHRNYYFQYLKQYAPETYQAILKVDHLLRDKTPKPPMDSYLFISRSRKRLEDLTPEDCCDAECFEYCGQLLWNGF